LGFPITAPNIRVDVGEVVAVNETVFSRTITVPNLVATDQGNYTCRASIMGLFIYSDEATATSSLVVEGGKLRVHRSYGGEVGLTVRIFLC